MTCLFAICSKDFNEVKSSLKNQYVLLNRLKHSIKATAILAVCINGSFCTRVLTQVTFKNI